MLLAIQGNDWPGGKGNLLVKIVDLKQLQENIEALDTLIETLKSRLKTETSDANRLCLHTVEPMCKACQAKFLNRTNGLYLELNKSIKMQANYQGMIDAVHIQINHQEIADVFVKMSGEYVEA